jgi:hypothetical protein
VGLCQDRNQQDCLLVLPTMVTITPTMRSYNSLCCVFWQLWESRPQLGRSHSVWGQSWEVERGVKAEGRTGKNLDKMQPTERCQIRGRADGGREGLRRWFSPHHCTQARQETCLLNWARERYPQFSISGTQVSAIWDFGGNWEEGANTTKNQKATQHSKKASRENTSYCGHAINQKPRQNQLLRKSP